MTETAAMTFTLLVAVAMMAAALYLILMGGRIVVATAQPSRKRRHIEPERRKAA